MRTARPGPAVPTAWPGPAVLTARPGPAVLALTLILATAIATFTAATAATATAAAPHKSFAGMVPDVRFAAANRAAAKSPDLPRPVAWAANLPYGGGPVLHANRTHVIFWQPARSGLQFDPGYEGLVLTFLAQVAADSHRPTNVYGLSGQYRDSGGPAAYNSTYGGAVFDSAPLPPNGCAEPTPTGPGWSVCLTDTQLEGEITRVAAAHRLPDGPDDIYFLLTPNGFGDCIDGGSTNCALGGSSGGYCGYHSTTGSGLLYAVIPYNAVPGHCQSDNPRPNSSTADPTISSLSHEHNETITDPEGDAWIDASDNEDGDLCITQFGPRFGGAGAGAWDQVIDGGRYYVQEEWSNQAGSCQARVAADGISFTASGRAREGRPVSFAAHAHDAHGAIIGYDWFFGDGRAGHGHALSHIFRRPGSYRVVLRVVDSWDNYASSALVVRVARAPGKRPPARAVG